MPFITEEDLLKKLAEAESEHKEARRIMTDAKKRWTEAETKIINSKLKVERVQEAIRVYHNTTYKKEHGFREMEIKAFREKFPELCEMAAERDRNRP